MKKKVVNYDLQPVKKIKGEGQSVWEGYEEIITELAKRTQKREKTVVVVECYPGVWQEEILEGMVQLNPSVIIHSDDCALDIEELTNRLEEDLTSDRVFGVMTTKTLRQYFIDEKLIKTQKQIMEIEKGIVLVYGFGASLVTKGDVLIMADVARWEIQLRYRSGMGNWRCDNQDAPVLSKYKRGFFAEWRWADKIKKELLPQIDYLIDANKKQNPKMISGMDLRNALEQFCSEPYRTVPYFDPGIWGGQWMKENFGLSENESNYAWSFDGVPEENSVLLQFGERVIQIPAMNITLYEPEKLLGNKVYARFGAEFPIRFDLLDTMGGGNLSLQVHPLTEYIKEQFNMQYTQDESYYLLDAQEEAFVYLGLKEGLNKEDMIRDLYRASEGEVLFPVEKYINKIPIQKHQHFSIPAGTVHCSGKNTMVLEISATPYIFTFKLWDWGRVGLDGIPRPIHLEHGIKNIQWDRDSKWVKEHLVHQEKVVLETDDVIIEKTGLYPTEFIETTRYSIKKEVTIEMEDSVHVMNLVEGEEATIESIDGVFEPFTIHYAETCIVPANVKRYKIMNHLPDKDSIVKAIVAKIR